MTEHIELREAYEATPGALADLAAEAIRALVHATRPGQARLTCPPDLADVLGSLRVLASRLTDAVVQLDAWLTTRLDLDDVGADAGYDADTVGLGVSLALCDAGQCFAFAERGLVAAHTSASKLSAVEPSTVVASGALTELPEDPR